MSGGKAGRSGRQRGWSVTVPNRRTGINPTKSGSAVARARVSPPRVALPCVGTTAGPLRGADLILAGKRGVFPPLFAGAPSASQFLGAGTGEGDGGEPAGCALEQQRCPHRCKPTAPGGSSSRGGSVSSLPVTRLPDPGAGKSLPAILLAAKLPFPGTSGTSQPGVPEQLRPSPFLEFKCHRVSSHRVPGEDRGDRRGSRGGTGEPLAACRPF